MFVNHFHKRMLIRSKCNERPIVHLDFFSRIYNPLSRSIIIGVSLRSNFSQIPQLIFLFSPLFIHDMHRYVIRKINHLDLASNNLRDLATVISSIKPVLLSEM